MTRNIALIGFGNVAQGLLEILYNKGDEFAQVVNVVAVTTRSRGSLYHPNGLNLEDLLTLAKNNDTFDSYPDYEGLVRNWNNLEIITESNADTIVELSYTNLETGQPAIDHCHTALEHGKHVISCNKGPVVLAYPELSELARQKGVQFLFEGTVMSGTPAVRLPLTTLVGNDILEIKGILNGTTNYILTEMEKGLDYEVALKQAQELGYAEADPTADVEGHDALGKVVILANVLLDVPLKVSDVDCKGISQLSSADIKQAQAAGKRWKLIGRIKKEQGWIRASVQPEMLPLSDPLANVMGATNAITYECDLMGPITLVGAGAGRVETGYSVLADLVNLP